MVDFSRAEGSKNHKNSFDSAAQSVINYMNELQETYKGYWEQLEKHRKERAAIIEHTIQILKNAKVKTISPLGRCNNEEINTELNRAIEELDFINREEVQCDLVKINNRYYEIVKLGKKLEALSEELSNTRVIEKDNDQEVIISLNDYKKTAKTASQDDELEKVVKIKKASDTLITNLENYLDSTRKLAFSPKEVIIEEEDLKIPVTEFARDEEYSIPEFNTSEDEEKINAYLESNINAEDEIDYVPYTLKDGISFVEITRRVYDDENLWVDLYKYGSNKGIIDRKASEYNMSVSEIVNDPTCLKDLTFQIPTELVTYKEIEDTNKLGRTA